MRPKHLPIVGITFLLLALATACSTAPATAGAGQDQGGSKNEAPQMTLVFNTIINGTDNSPTPSVTKGVAGISVITSSSPAAAPNARQAQDVGTTNKQDTRVDPKAAGEGAAEVVKASAPGGLVGEAAKLITGEGKVVEKPKGETTTEKPKTETPPAEPAK